MAVVFFTHLRYSRHNRDMNSFSTPWKPDVLGPGFECAQFPLNSDFQGAVITSLVRHISDADPHALPTPTSRPQFAFLAIHGWNDYFYQRELARHISALGGAFYALDLRKYGRSHLDGQYWGYIEDLSDYDAEVHAALDAIHHDQGSDVPLVLYGHSTGGLTAALWADRHPGALAALILNSPWIALQGAAATRLAAKGATESLRRLAPTAILPIPDSGFYHRTLTGNHLDSGDLPADASSDPFFTTGWEPNEAWRGKADFAVRAGWFNAILEGHHAVAAGLSITAPILILTSARSVVSSTWNTDFLSADSVLTVENIWRQVPSLGASVTLIKLEGAIHDVTFSHRSVRDQAFSEIGRFLQAWLSPR